jgi:hypothetical protein
VSRRADVAAFTKPHREGRVKRDIVTVHVLLLAVLGAGAGCRTTMPILEKHSTDFKTTALFSSPCSVAKGDHKPPERQDCEHTHLTTMVERFMSIQEMDETNGIPGDTIEEVRRKGFTIYVDGEEKVRRPNTRAVYGNDALALVGMGVAPPPLQKPEEIKAYTEFMGLHYGEEYAEKDMRKITDRVCINTRDERDVGDDRVFAIVWRGGQVFKRVIKGGPINNPKSERGFLLCPGSFLADTVTNGIKRAADSLVP